MGMAPQRGRVVAKYRLFEKLGEGGMGVVWRGEDVRLGRQVALKFLTAEAAHDPGRRQRFEQEARAAAGLSHPGIATVYELVEAEGQIFIAFEYVPGVTLRNSVTAGGLPPEELLDIAVDLADALASAHAAGIVHRDLKPENLMRMPSGHCKVLDFGLARFNSPAAGYGATRTYVTEQGTVMGTVAYMAPEQLEGKSVDFRADIFSFGTLLYELATGIHPFAGSSSASIAAAVLKDDPRPLHERAPVHPAELERIIRKSLRKRREERYQSTLDLVVDLRSLRRELKSGTAVQSSTQAQSAPVAPALTECSFTLTERLCRKINRATLDPRIIGDRLSYVDNQVASDVLVLFLHGLGLDHREFEPVLRRLPYRGLSPTLYGYEPNRKARISLSFADHVVIVREWLRDSIERLCPAIVVLVGCSLGGDMGFEILATPPGEAPVRLDAFLSLECNLCLDTCFCSRVLAGVAPDRPDISVRELRRVSENVASLDEWLNIHQYLVKILRKFQSDMGVLQRASADLVRPFQETPGFAVFARWFRHAREHVPILRLVFASDSGSAAALAQLKLENLDKGILGEDFPEEMISLTPNVDHFDLMAADALLLQIEDIVSAARKHRSAASYAKLNEVRPSRLRGKVLLAVRPFENLSRDEEEEYFSDGLTEEMITQLARLSPERLGVIARTSSMRYKGSSKRIREIAAELGVNYVLEGSVRRSGDRVRITAQLIQAEDETHLWAETYERNLTDILKLQTEVSQAIAKQAQVKLTPREEQRIAQASQVSPAAYEAYLKGRYLWNQRTEEGMRNSIALFEQALAFNPDFAMAYAGIADAYVMLACRGMAPTKATFRNAKAAARKAIDLDSDLGEAHGSLAHVRLHDWDWQGLEKDFERAIELNPANGIVYYWYGEFLMSLGRPDHAIAVTQKAYAADPLSPVLGSSLAMILYLARRFGEAAEILERAQQINPDHFLLHFRMGFVSVQLRQYDTAIAEFERAMCLSNRSTETQAGVALAYSAAGNAALAQPIIDDLEHPANNRYVLPYNIAKIHAAAGNAEKTLEWLERAYNQASADLIELNSEPLFDAFRTEARFLDLMRRVGWNV